MEYSRDDFLFISSVRMSPYGDYIPFKGIGYRVAPAGVPRYTTMDIYYVQDEDKAYWLRDLEEGDPENFAILMAKLMLVRTFCSVVEGNDWDIHTNVSVHMLAPGILVVITARWLAKDQVPEKVNSFKGPDTVPRKVFLSMLPAFIAAGFEFPLTELKPTDDTQDLYNNIRECVQDEFADQLVTEKEVLDAIQVARASYL